MAEEKTIDKKIRRLINRLGHSIDGRQMRDFSRQSSWGGMIPPSKFDDTADKLRARKMDAKEKKIMRQLDAAIAEKSNQESKKPYRLKPSQRVGKSGGGRVSGGAGMMIQPDVTSKGKNKTLLKKE